ncbi:hypothetical protein K466DRAFT_585795 [Polyporus arcularius HHB13444]|uniref:NADH dehydrogenase [ubiquinone] 1 alpha subcomplex subunit n=1 Tax=Polyporus arcularius HHB13444 TaxID=1314778 RepID=A0A5C3PIK4_9APHY|nr:hypothetical protein K466DRAFT_585795 [Polyporus arcularius HHB13444]
MSFLARLFRRFRSPTGFVGRDLEGNKFFEYPSVSDDPRRTKRVVKYAPGRDMLHYVSGERRLAVQWTSWLTHTRSHPPTLEELQADLERQRRVRLNAAMIEARDREQAAQIAAAQQTVVRHVEPPSQQPSMPEAVKAAPATAPLPQAEQGPLAAGKDAQRLPQTRIVPDQRSDPSSPWKQPPRDEPQSWQPRAVVRRGG